MPVDRPTRCDLRHFFGHYEARCLQPPELCRLEADGTRYDPSADRPNGCYRNHEQIDATLMRVLLVEDNERLSGLLTEGLGAAGFAVDRVTTVADATEAAIGRAYSAAILDLGLPDGDGLDVLRELRRRGNATPILILTARGSTGDRVAGLQSGADDYLGKPFALEELVARLRALLRRPGQLLGQGLKIGNVVLDTESRQLTVAGRMLASSVRELAVLEIMMRRSGHVVPKKLVEDQLYGMASDIGSNAVEVYVHRIRKQLAAAGAAVRIHTVRGVGYMISGSE